MKPIKVETSLLDHSTIELSEDAAENKEEREELRWNYQTEAHKYSQEELEDVYHTKLRSDDLGLSYRQHQQGLREYGENRLTPPREASQILKWTQYTFGGLFQTSVWIASMLCFVSYTLNTSLTSTLVIGMVIAIFTMLKGTLLYFLRGSNSDEVMQGFKNFLPQTVDVYRDSLRIQTEAIYLVPGDVIELTIGDKVPADVRIIKCSENLQVDNSCLTGECEPSVRSPDFTSEDPLETQNIAFFGTLVVRGRGTALVIKTGDDTLMGRIASLVETGTSPDDNLVISKGFKILERKVTIVMVVFAIFGFVAAGTTQNVHVTIMTFAGIIVACIPLGLYITVIFSMVFGAQQLAKQNSLVKTLTILETVGSTTVICSETTGILTKNIMTVSHVYYDLNEFMCDTDIPQNGDFDSASGSFQKLIRCAVLCNNARFKNDQEIVGDTSETALIKFCNPQYENGIDEFRQSHPKKHEIPFNSAKKWQLTVCLGRGSEPPFILLKGAPERVLNYCDEYIFCGRPVPLTEDVREKILSAVQNLGGKGERVLGFCHLELSGREYPPHFEFDGDCRDNVNFPFGRENEKGLVFLGLISMIDPPRPGVREAVQRCKSEGVKVIMVTGQHPLTAKAIAQKVGIIENKTADELAQERSCEINPILEDEARAVVVAGYPIPDDFTSNQARELWDRILAKDDVVFARTSPKQKLDIVKACQARGDVVAVTGDGCGDSPALQKADVGIALGITGTDVAKDSCDVILLDDNFSSIIHMIGAGNMMVQNLKKSICFMLSSVVPEVLPFVLFAILNIPLPLTILLIIFNGIVLDIVVAVSLASAEQEEHIHPDENPFGRFDVTWRMISFCYIQIGLTRALSALCVYAFVFLDFGFHVSHLVGIDRDTMFAPVTPELQAEAQYLYCWDSSSIKCKYSPLAEELFPETSQTSLADKFPMHWKDRVNALQYAQTAYFITVVITQWVTLLACKTRSKSAFSQRLKSNFMKALFFSLGVSIFICYVPGVNGIMGTKPLHFGGWLAAILFSVFMFGVDELHKAWIRKRTRVERR